MSTEEEFVKAFYQLLNDKFWKILFQLLVAGVVLQLMRTIIEGIAAYIIFRMDRHICVGRSVEVNGKVGRIKRATWSQIVIETDEGFMNIPTREWKNSKVMVLKDHLVFDRRRSKGNTPIIPPES